MSLVLKMDPKDCHKAAEMRVSSLVAALGWEKKRNTVDGVRGWRWYPPGHKST